MKMYGGNIILENLYLSKLPCVMSDRDEFPLSSTTNFSVKNIHENKFPIFS